MTRNAWHILKDDQSVTVTRRVPARFDVESEAVLPLGDKLRVAQQVRQDLWRALQNQRGFSPVVEVREQGGQLSIRAGGQCDRIVARRALEARIADVLNDSGKRARWVRFARLRNGGSHV
ncbi:hypothetical protein [Cognatishimia maritima]|uniref:Uncharacterized protein n=1 Tax=Cognatishimia maritima TaxID=870908 RepID=A0A1M5JT29_9RHOB|nr:hypothetical protein [Cognatishimia maritima]SHG43429.1 hypothetical protein SAMN04488044_0769 [Cognatishimia maritima]